MALELVTTVGGASSNCYNTLAEFNAYLAAVFPKPNTAVNASEDNKSRALVFACQQITLLQYDGARTAESQALPFPRIALVNPDTDYRSINYPKYYYRSVRFGPAYYATDIIPDRVKRAECVIAQALLEGTYTPNTAGATGDVTEFAADGARFVFGKAKQGRDKTQWPQEATELLKPLLKQLRFVRS